MKIEQVHVTCPVCKTAAFAHVPKCPQCAQDLSAEWKKFDAPPPPEKPKAQEKKK